MMRRTLITLVGAVLACGGTSVVSYNVGHRAGAEEGRQAGEEFGRAWFEGFDKVVAERSAKDEAEREARKQRNAETYERTLMAYDYRADPGYQALLATIPEKDRPAFEERYREQFEAGRERLIDAEKAKADSPRQPAR